jgi:hypothetical protein
MVFERFIWKDEGYYLYPTEEMKAKERQKQGRVKTGGFESKSLEGSN